MTESARLGIVLPANNTVLEPEAYEAAPEGVTVHFARMLIGSATNDSAAVLAMERSAATAVRQLAEAMVDAVAYACVSTSLVLGRTWDEEFVARVSERNGGHPTETAAMSVVRALRDSGVQRVAVATPYPADLAERVPGYFGSWGISVVSQVDLPTSDLREVGRRGPREVRELVHRLDRSNAEGAAVLATDLAVTAQLRELRESLGFPVIGTNDALLSWGFRSVERSRR